MLTPAEFNAMPRRTATGIAEERFERLARTMQVGPSGLPIPRSRSAYRVSEAELLGKMHRTAFGAYERKALPWERIQQAASILVADIERRYPHAEMLVLEKYGHAREYSFLDISLGNNLHYKVNLAVPLLTIGKATSFTVSPIKGTDVALVPAGLELFVQRATDLAQELNTIRFGYDGPAKWVRDFRARTQRMPKWQEIEDAWPIIGNWLAAERKRMEAAS